MLSHIAPNALSHTVGDNCTSLNLLISPNVPVLSQGREYFESAKNLLCHTLAKKKYIASILDWRCYVKLLHPSRTKASHLAKTAKTEKKSQVRGLFGKKPRQCCCGSDTLVIQFNEKERARRQKKDLRHKKSDVCRCGGRPVRTRKTIGAMLPASTTEGLSLECFPTFRAFVHLDSATLEKPLGENP